ncbi:uncharacterized protein At4g26450-like [Zingiber officinale]|uniref:uncharacterized protein At4g26450-like n=1 Tax=Zingiber officinale TaxID=94328 RepID=UPI001C4C3776|nr:uncharacterized protein At4g26450-like [Zingiber officinale]
MKSGSGPNGMQSKYRNAGDGYRSGASFGRHQRRGGFNRSYPKPHNRPATKLEILMEAGRLAAEYLVSKGVFPSSAFPRDLVSDDTPHEFAGPARESPIPSSFNDSRVPAMERLGDAGSGAGYARKRFNDGYDRFGPRKNARARRTTGSYNRGDGGPDWGRERAGYKPWLERSRSYSDMVEEEDDDFLGPRYNKDRQSGHEEVGSSRVAGDEQQSKNEVVGETLSESEDTGSKASSYNTRKDAPTEGCADVNRADDVMTSNPEVGEVKSCESEDVGNKGVAEIYLTVNPGEVEECGSVIDHGDTLLKLGGSPKVPRRLRSSLAHKNTIFHTSPKVGNGVECASEGETEMVLDKLPIDGSLKQTRASLTYKSFLDYDLSNEGVNVVEVSGGETETIANKFPTDYIVKDSHIHHNVNPECEMPVKLSDDDIQSSKQSIESQCDLQQSLPCSKMSLTAVGVGVGEEDKVTEQTGKEELNKQVSSPPPNTSQQNEFSQLDGVTETQSSLFIKMSSQDVEITKPGYQLKPITAPSVSIVDAETILKIDGVKCNQPTSFKIFDLNVMEAPDVTDVHEDHMLGASHTSALPQASGNQLSVDFSLSRNNRANDTYDSNQLSGDRKAIQVIDLEEDSPMEVNDVLKSKNEIIYPVENALNHTTHSDELPVVQDTYGPVISEYLEADMRCSPQDQAELNNLQVGMGLHGAEGFAVVDDSIYGSLGDIGFIDVWDQPPQDYEKFF